MAPLLEPSLRLGFLMFCCRQCSRPVHPTAPRRLHLAHVQPWKLGSSGLRPSACASPRGRAILTTGEQLDIKRWQAACSRKTRGLLAGTRGGGPVPEGTGGVPDQHPARSQQLSEGPAQQTLPTGWRHLDAARSRAALQGLPRRRHGPWAQPRERGPFAQRQGYQSSIDHGPPIPDEHPLLKCRRSDCTPGHPIHQTAIA